MKKTLSLAALLVVFFGITACESDSSLTEAQALYEAECTTCNDINLDGDADCATCNDINLDGDADCATCNDINLDGDAECTTCNDINIDGDN